MISALVLVVCTLAGGVFMMLFYILPWAKEEAVAAEQARRLAEDSAAVKRAADRTEEDARIKRLCVEVLVSEKLIEKKSLNELYAQMTGSFAWRVADKKGRKKARR